MAQVNEALEDQAQVVALSANHPSDYGGEPNLERCSDGDEVGDEKRVATQGFQLHPPTCLVSATVYDERGYHLPRLVSPTCHHQSPLRSPVRHHHRPLAVERSERKKRGERSDTTFWSNSEIHAALVCTRAVLGEQFFDTHLTLIEVSQLEEH
ncbi:hypothetical protein [Oryza sativa Japonica Group]|uniref:Uncharacterized protein P0013F10.18 n=1 Tax=Oryza sativa subsp. japonica TaxID=39947 RepID=Q5VRW1_ORYSJ|nr:hypothetical protein [Oryza sativa Japonica Group]